MKKRLVLLGLALIFVLGSVFGGAFAPLMANYITEAASAHSADIANYSIEHLPKKSFQVGDDVPVNQPRTSTGIYYTLTRQVSENNIVWGVSHSNGNGITGLPDEYTAGGVSYGSHPGFDNKFQIGDQDGFNKFTLEGNYTYNFYSEEEYRKLKLVGTTHMVTGGSSFHSYTITVLATNFTIELPSNDKDILPNVVTPGTEITLPLPSHLNDLKGRNLLDLDPENTDAKDARREAYLPEVIADSSLALSGFTDKQLIKYFFDGTAFPGTVLDTPDAPITCETIVDWIYRDMTMVISSYPAADKYIGVAYGQPAGIKNATDRKFTPMADGRTCSATYSYENAYNNITSNPFSTSKISVERPYPANSGSITDANAKDNILLVTTPEISFKPSSSSFKIGSETTLPTATVSIHGDSKIQFDSTTTLTNYTYIAVRYRPKTDKPNDRQWRWLGSEKDTEGLATILPEGTTENSSAIMRISDFSFEPERVGDYEFRYYTTTIFGIGDKNKVGDRKAMTDEQIHTFGGREFIKYTPFDTYITIDQDNQAPEIKWTTDYEYELIDGEMKPTIDGTTELKFEDAPNYSKMLPGATTSSKTKIMKGEELVIPALLGVDNSTASHELNYQFYLYRYQDGVRYEEVYAVWYSGANGDNTTVGGGVWKHNETFRIPFTDAAFNNSGTNDPNAILAKFSGFSVVGKYDFSIRVYDETNIMSEQYQYTFEVVDPVNWTPSRPTLNGLFRAGQDEYHEGDKMVFNVATFSDKYTADRDINVRYFLSIDEGKDIERLLNDDTSGAGKAVEIKDGEDGMSISGSIASFELKDDNVAGSYVLDALNAVWEEGETYTDGTTVLAAGNPIIGTKKHEGFLTFRVYAIARNYHAMTKITEVAGGDDLIGYEVGRTYQYNATTTLDFSIENISVATVTPTTPNFMRAVFDSVTVFDATYGGAAVITDKFGGEYTYNKVTGESAVTKGTGSPSWYEDSSDIFRYGEEVAIPALRFFYPNEIGPLYSTISYSVTYDGFTKDTTSYNSQGKAVGGGWQGMLGATEIKVPDGLNTVTGTLPAIGFKTTENGRTFGAIKTANDEDKKTAGQRFFTPMGVGEHFITVKVTNAGGNVSVFIGKITVVGTLQASPPRLLGERTTPMRVGESEKMPTVEVTIGGVKYVTGKIDESNGIDNLQGYVVTAEIDPILGRQAKVGTFEIEFWSAGGSEYVPVNNGFTPLAIDTYKFTYVIEIRDNLEYYPSGHTIDGQDVSGQRYHIIPMLDPNIRESAIDTDTGKVTPPILCEKTWEIDVESIQSTDLILKLDGTPYTKLAQTSSGQIGSYYDKAFGSEGIAFYDPRNKNTYNFFTDILRANAEEGSIEISDSQLFGGLEPFIPSDSTTPDAVPEYWQYGRIYVPNYLKQFADEVKGISDDFNKNAKGYITVTKSGSTLLDTRADSDTATLGQVENLGAEPYYWFRPTGLLVAEYEGDATSKDLDWAMNNAANKNQWKAVANSLNNYLKVDGKYEVTYALEYMGVTLTKTYNIAMGDTQQPKITLADNSDNDRFSNVYKVGDKFTFNTDELTVKGPKNTEIFNFDKGMDSWLAKSYQNANFSIVITPYSNIPLSPTIIMNKTDGSQDIIKNGTDDGHNYEIVINEAKGTEEHSFIFNESGSYTITIHVTSESGVLGTKIYTLTVEDKTPKSPIAPEEVWGTILIVLSIGLFLGVIIYFIRTGQQTKFASVKSKPKKAAKEKESGDGGVV